MTQNDGGSTPALEALEAVFAALLEQARRDPDFGEALLTAVRSGLGSAKASGSEAEPTSPPDALVGKPIIAKVAGDRPSAHACAAPASGQKRRGACASSAEPGPLDLDALLADRGRRGAQDALLQAPYTVRQLRALAKKRGVSLSGAGRRRRDVVDALITGAAAARADAFG